MKKNRSKLILSFLLIIFTLFSSLVIVNAEYESGKTYHILKNGGALKNVSANSVVTKKTTTKTEYVENQNACNKKGGTYDTNDCAYQWAKSYVTCYTGPGVTSRCAPAKSGVTGTVTYTDKGPKYYTTSAAKSKCESVTAKVSMVCCSSQGCGSPQNFTMNYYKSNGSQECTLKNPITVNGKQYTKDDMSGSCHKLTASKVCACNVSTTTTTEKSLYTEVAKVKETGATGYCVAPGLNYPDASTVFTPHELDTSNCKKGTKKFGCGLIAILEESKKIGADFDAIIIALRMWAAEVGYISATQDGMTSVGLGNDSEQFFMKSPIYSVTAKYIQDHGYTGQQGTTGLEKNVIYAMNANGLTSLQNGIKLFNAALNGEYNLWTASIEIPEEVEPDKNGNFKFTIKTNFDTTNTKDISIVSNNLPNITLTVNASSCASGSCEVTGKIANYGVDNCPQTMSFTMKFTDKRDMSKNVHLLESDNPEKIQRFVVYDETQVESTVIKSLKLKPNCEPEPSYICTTHQTIEYTVPDKCSKGTTGKIEDPEINCVINVPNLQNNYDYTTLYIKSTNSTVGNSSSKSSSWYANIGTGFCQMQCRETVTLKFFGTAHSDSTRFYTYGSVLETIIGDRECASEIDYKKWRTAYDQANENVRTTWNTYKYWENVHVYTTPRPETIQCSYPGGSSCSCGCCCCGYDSYGRCTSNSCCCYCSSAPACSVTKTKLYWDPKAYTETAKSGSTYTAYSSQQHGYVSCSGSICGGWSSCTGMDGNPNAWAGAYSSAKSAYKSAVRSRETLIADLQNCNLYSSYKLFPYTTEDYGSSLYSRSNTSSAYYQATTGYQFNPSMTYDYESDYNSLISIGTNVRLTSKTSARYCVNCVTVEETGATTLEEVVYWVCTGNQTGAKCTDKKVKVPKNTLAYIRAKKTATFSQDEVFATTIPDGEIIPISSKTNTELSLSKYNYIFPLEIGKQSGTYDVDSTYDKLGDANRKSMVKIEGGDYDCWYTVTNLITIPAGFYYHQIDVTYPFPNGISSGTWNTQRAKQLIAKVKNDGELVYNKTAKYKFIINPENIHALRQYNRQLDYDGQGYNDFNLDCDCDTEICYCTSNFLKDISYGGIYSNFVKRYYRNGVRQ